jgi:hypothetical protein
LHGLLRHDAAPDGCILDAAGIDDENLAGLVRC